jgi:hypothetical protein
VPDLSEIVDPAQFDGLNLRFRMVIERVLELDQMYQLRERDIAFVRRLLASRQFLKAPAHAENVASMWRALTWFQAEVDLAECELDCLVAELGPPKAASAPRPAMLPKTRQIPNKAASRATSQQPVRRAGLNTVVCR